MTGFANTAPHPHPRTEQLKRRFQRDFLPWILAQVTCSLTSADKQVRRGHKPEGLGSSSKAQGLLLQELMLPYQCGSPESSCQHSRATKSDIIQQPGVALALSRFCIYKEFSSSVQNSALGPVEKSPECNQHHELRQQQQEGTGAGAGPQEPSPQGLSAHTFLCYRISPTTLAQICS